LTFLPAGKGFADFSTVLHCGQLTEYAMTLSQVGVGRTPVADSEQTPVILNRPFRARQRESGEIASATAILTIGGPFTISAGGRSGLENDMELNPYSPCPCGSGKQFKWCCQPIHRQIARVFELDEEGQHDAALTMMDDVVRQNPGNPEVYGRKALLLFQNERAEDAEKALEEAFHINANYAFGYFLKARFRLYEGEIAGALILLRKAAELYSSEAHDILAMVNVEIIDCEMKLNRPIAAHAAAELALKHSPSDENLRKSVANVFGAENPNLPKTAWQRYEFKPLSDSAASEHKAAWKQALASAGSGKLAEGEAAFAQLVAQDANNAAAWYNLGLVRAWLGKNADALEALDRYVALEANEEQAAQAWALGEVLRLGQGMEDQADLVEYSHVVGLRNAESLMAALNRLQQEKLLTGVQVQEEQGMLSGMILDPPPPALTPELEAKQSPHLGAYLLVVQGLLRVWNTHKDALDRAFANLQKHAGGSLDQAGSMRGPARFHDVFSEALVFPRNATSKEEVARRVTEGVQQFFEEAWLHRPLKSLGGSAPIDAAGHGQLRKKVRGVVGFIADCAASAKLGYDFDGLRRKLGLLETLPAPSAAAGPDIGAMGAAELSALTPESLDDAHLEDAFRAALKLDARDLAAQFARAAVGRPAPSERPDRYPLFNHLIQLALGRADTAAAMDEVNAGEADDCKYNEGRRRNDYELRRGQLHAKRGEHDQAQDVFDRLIQRVPNELKYRASAAEAMLSARQGKRALRYAEEGLAEARKQQNRDSEGHLMELADAARRQGS
jgi:tetratricopeptide (TPR) repeat protein